MVKVAVLGAGINGVTCALKIKEKFKDYDVVLISKEFSPDTTGDGSGGLWYPYICGSTPPHLVTKWGGETYEYLHALWREGGLDVSMMPVYALHRREPGGGGGGGGGGVERPDWAGRVFGYRDLDGPQLEYFSQLCSVKYTSGHTFTTFVVQPSKIISHLYGRFVSAGGRVVAHPVTSLTDPILSGCDIVVNCTGLGAREIVPDRAVFPVRGQIFKVKAPWLNMTILDKDSGHYLIPNADTCVLGGTSQEHNYSTQLNEEDTQHILSACHNMVPALKHAEIVSGWAGLRPARHAVRLDAERRGGGGRLYIHNYGHGGSGLTLFWGCGTEVLSLLERHARNESHSVQSKL